MKPAPWPVMGSACEQLLARLVNVVRYMGERDLDDEERMRRAQHGAEVMAEADRYLASINQFVDRMHARDMGRSI